LTCPNLVSYRKDIAGQVVAKHHKKFVEGKTSICGGKIYAHVAPWAQDHPYEDGVVVEYQCSKCNREIKPPTMPTDEKTLDDFLTYFVGML
jgi:hypothetical protein